MHSVEIVRCTDLWEIKSGKGFGSQISVISCRACEEGQCGGISFENRANPSYPFELTVEEVDGAVLTAEIFYFICENG